MSSLHMAVLGRTLSVTSPGGAATVTIFDYLGRRMAEHRQGVGTRTYPLQGMAGGLYFVKVAGDRESVTRAVMVY